jgi:hypothetical protein
VLAFVSVVEEAEEIERRNVRDVFTVSVLKVV